MKALLKVMEVLKVVQGLFCNRRISLVLDNKFIKILFLYEMYNIIFINTELICI